MHALRGVSLDIESGSVHAVVGPSGCGKSSLLYILGLLDLPDAGRVSIESEPVSHLSDDELAQRRSKFIGFIFQFHFLMEDFTAQENVMIPMRKLGELSDSDMRERAAGLLEAVGLGDKLRRPSRHLSGGEQQRVAIARALANDPRVILADEPTGNLDTANSERAFELLQNIVQEGGKALLLATHNPVIAEACDWVHEMKDGRITASNRAGRGKFDFLSRSKRRAMPLLKVAESWQLAAPPLISQSMENILPILIADAPEALTKCAASTYWNVCSAFCSASDFARAIVFSTTPEIVGAELAKRSWARQQIIVHLASGGIGPVTPQLVLDQSASERFLIVPANIYCDARLLAALCAKAVVPPHLSIPIHQNSHSL